MTMPKRREGGTRAFFLNVVGRPLLFVFWAMVLWGTFYDLVLLHAVFEHGIYGAFSRALSGTDKTAAMANLLSALLAVLVWTSVAVLVWWSARERRRL